VHIYPFSHFFIYRQSCLSDIPSDWCIRFSCVFMFPQASHAFSKLEQAYKDATHAYKAIAHAYKDVTHAHKDVTRTQRHNTRTQRRNARTQRRHKLLHKFCTMIMFPQPMTRITFTNTSLLPDRPVHNTHFSKVFSAFVFLL